MAKKTAAKKQTAKKQTAKKATAKVTTSSAMALTSTSGALTPQANKANATIAPVSNFSQLAGYWDVLLNIYGTVAVKAVSLTGTSLTFTILNPNTGAEFGGGTQFTVNLEDGESTYPGFPGTAQLIKPTLEKPFAYLLLSTALLDKYLGAQVGEYAGPKRPFAASL